MLYELLDQIIERIVKLRSEDGPEFYSQMEAHGCDLGDGIENQILRDAITIGFSKHVIMRLGEMPRMLREIVERVGARSTDPAERCSLLLALVYVARPIDIIPDDAPGGYGFIDDYVVLNALHLEHVRTFENALEKAEALKANLKLASVCLGARDRELLEKVVSGAMGSLHAFRNLDRHALDHLAQSMIENPLVADAPLAGKTEPDPDGDPFLGVPGTPERDGENLIIPFADGGILISTPTGIIPPY